jgi:hypothetical protein
LCKKRTIGRASIQKVILLMVNGYNFCGLEKRGDVLGEVEKVFSRRKLLEAMEEQTGLDSKFKEFAFQVASLRYLCDPKRYCRMGKTFFII